MPPRQPRSLKILKGETRPSRIGGHEPAPAPIRPDCPAFLNEAAAALWEELAPTLDDLGVLTIVDASVLAEYCTAYEEAQRLDVYLNEHGLTFTSTNGYIGQRPEVSIRNKSWDRCRRAGAELGIGAASRGRIDLPPAKDTGYDPVREILKSTAPHWKG